MTTKDSSGGEPTMPFEVELYLATEFQRFAEEANGHLEPARKSTSYLGCLAMGREGIDANDDMVVLSAFSGFVMSEFADFTEHHPFMKVLRESGMNEEAYLEKGRMFGSLILHGLEVLEWSEQDDPAIKALDVVCWKVAQHLVDSIDSYERLRFMATSLSERGMAA